jgi:3-oxoacyl-[acyl-carrier protein] reductase
MSQSEFEAGSRSSAPLPSSPKGRVEPPEPGEGEEATAVDSPSQDRDVVEQLLDEVGTPQTRPQPMISTNTLRGKVAVVSGGSSGIGRAIVLELARTGVHVAFSWLDRGDPQEAEEVHRLCVQVREMEVRVFARQCDVRDSRAVQSFVNEAHDRLGGLHILVNNAGVGQDRALWHMTDDQWDEVMDTNLTGAFHMLRAVVPFFRAQEHGKIVNIASVHALRSEFGLANYSASKAGLLGLTRSAAVELGPRNINVNALAPGYIRTTRLTDAVPSEILDAARERAALGRLGDPQDVAGAVIFLCSEAARHITGAVLPVDGGYLL